MTNQTIQLPNHIQQKPMQEFKIKWNGKLNRVGEGERERVVKLHRFELSKLLLEVNRTV